MKVNIKILGSNALEIRSGGKNDFYLVELFTGTGSTERTYNEIVEIIHEIVFKISPEGRGIDLFYIDSAVNITIEWCDLYYDTEEFLKQLKQYSINIDEDYLGVSVGRLMHTIVVTKDNEILGEEEFGEEFVDKRLVNDKAKVDHSYEWGAGHGYEGAIQVLTFLGGVGLSIGVNYISARIEEYRQRKKKKGDNIDVLINYNLPETVHSILEDYNIDKSSLVVRNLSSEYGFYGINLVLMDSNHQFIITIDGQNKLKELKVIEIKKDAHNNAPPSTG